MSIMNVTPDSFSDAGQNFDADLSVEGNSVTGAIADLEQDFARGNGTPEIKSTLQHGYMRQVWATIHQHISQGADILDIGGQSSRPGAESISAEEEFGRIQPAIAVAASMFPKLPLSIDTYRSKVATSAMNFLQSQSATPDHNENRSLNNSAFVINDISAGTLDAEMLKVAAESHSTIILMHMRGTPETMTRKEHTSYSSGVVEGVATELLDRVKQAEEAGIPRWRIILDPGIGFAKTAEQNLELLRNLPRLRAWPGLHGLPWLVGNSRKKTIGTILGQQDARARTWMEVCTNSPVDRSDPDQTPFTSGKVADRPASERDWGTAATVAAAVQGGADIVRVHNVKAMADVVAVADAIWRDDSNRA
ncbi:MAG: dihydropteroate synthase [Janthinobacterium lividum]